MSASFRLPVPSACCWPLPPIWACQRAAAFGAIASVRIPGLSKRLQYPVPGNFGMQSWACEEKTSPLSMSATAAMRLPPVLPKAKTAECRLQPISLKLQKHTSEYTASPKQPTADTAKLPSMPESQSLGVESASHGSHLLQPSFCKCREQSYVSQLQLLSSLCLSSESSGLACLASIHASSFKTVSDHSMAKPRASADGKACFTPVPVPLRTAPLCRSCCRRPPSDGHRPGTGLARRPKGDPLSFRTSGVMPRQPSSPPAREVNPGLTDHATPAD